MTTLLPPPSTELRLLRVLALRGPNIWTYRAALEAWLDLGALEDWPSNTLPGFVDRLVDWLPALKVHRCGVGEVGGFLERLRDGTWMGHVLEHAVIELLNLGGVQTGFGQTRSTSKPGVYRMVVRARDQAVARVALDQGLALVRAAIDDAPFDLAAAVAAVREQAEDSYFGPSTAAIVAAATERGIPHIRLTDGNLVQLGHGARSRRIWTAETDRTSAIAEGIARDKDLTKRLLAACGVPVPEGRIVFSADEAWAAAEDIGLPVVVKPTDGNHGRGVTLDLTTHEQVREAFERAREHGTEVLVERCIPGEEHRLLVVGGRVVAAARGETAWITGDGRSSVAALIDSQLNSDPRRGTHEGAPLNLIDCREDGTLLADLKRQRLTPDDVPATGQRVLIQRNGNVANDCTDDVHPDVAHAVGLAARIVGLDIAGIDLVAEDINRPLAPQRGAIVEVNAGPGLLMHLKPAVGTPRPVGEAIVHQLIPAGDHGRIPIVGVLGSTPQRPVIARLIAWLAQRDGRHVGLANAEGLFLDGRRIDARPANSFDAGQQLLTNRTVDAAVFSCAAATVLSEGLPYDRCAVALVTDADGRDAVADAFDVHDDEQMFKVLRTPVDVVLDDGAAVLNADDARLLPLAPLCDGAVVLYGDAHNPALRAHRAVGGRVVFLRGERLVLAHGDGAAHEQELATACPLPFDVALPAVAAAWALGVEPELLTAGLHSFDSAPAGAAASHTKAGA
jgi:cyanophycin synthetase